MEDITPGLYNMILRHHQLCTAFLQRLDDRRAFDYRNIKIEFGVFNKFPLFNVYDSS